MYDSTLFIPFELAGELNDITLLNFVDAGCDVNVGQGIPDRCDQVSLRRPFEDFAPLATAISSNSLRPGSAGAEPMRIEGKGRQTGAGSFPIACSVW
jgi:hypothetical protein